MISALAPDRPDQAFNIAVLPGCTDRGGPVPDAHRPHPCLEDASKCSVIIANEIFRRAVPGKRLGDLPRKPLGCRVSGHRGPQQPSSSVAKNKKCVELFEGDRRDHKQINRCNPLGVIAKERLPGLRWPIPPGRHVDRNRETWIGSLLEGAKQARAAVAALTFALDAAPTSAQQGGYPLYPWCAYYGNGRTSCYFSTFERCRKAISGAGGTCTQNSWYAAYGPYYSFGGGPLPSRVRRSR